MYHERMTHLYLIFIYLDSIIALSIHVDPESTQIKNYLYFQVLQKIYLFKVVLFLHILC
jgi:hypothetical protein